MATPPANHVLSRDFRWPPSSSTVCQTANVVCYSVVRSCVYLCVCVDVDTDTLVDHWCERLPIRPTDRLAGIAPTLGETFGRSTAFETVAPPAQLPFPAGPAESAIAAATVR